MNDRRADLADHLVPANLPSACSRAWRLIVDLLPADAGMDYRSAMSVTGHKTQAVFERYRIVDARRTAEALEAMQTHRRRMRAVTDTAGRSKNTDKTRTAGPLPAPAPARTVKRDASFGD